MENGKRELSEQVTAVYMYRHCILAGAGYDHPEKQEAEGFILGHRTRSGADEP